MDTHQEPVHIPVNQEEREQLIRPGIEINTLVWSILLGLPGLLLFLILQKQASMP